MAARLRERTGGDPTRLADELRAADRELEAMAARPPTSGPGRAAGT